MTLLENEVALDYRYRPPVRLSSLSVVMPAHNEAENIERAVLEAMDGAATVTDDFEVIVVDDGSIDGTAEEVAALAELYGRDRVKLIRNERNLGYGPTVRRAWEAASKEWMLFTDSDCQFDVGEVALLVPLTDHHDVVAGWREDRQDPFIRRVNAWIFNLASRVFFRTGLRDIDCAFKLMRTSDVQSMVLTSNSAMVNTELMYQARVTGLRVAQRPVTHRERLHGESSGGDPAVIVRAMREFFALRARFNRGPDARLSLHSACVGLLAMLVGVVSTVWAYHNHTILAYGDAEAHLNISKRVTGGLTPGFAQLGSVWVPLPHVLMAPFTANDWLWRTGLAGACVSVPSLVLLAVMSYRLAHVLSGRYFAAWLAPLVIVGNPNMLYLSATPMTEVLLLSLVTTSLYFLARWVTSGGLRYLSLTAVFAALSTLARYDGWMLVALELVVVGGVAAYRLRTARGVEGTLLVFSLLGLSGIGGWLLWNQIIFKDPLYFASSVYGSSEQQKFFLANGLLPTYHNPVKSVVYWLEDVRLIGGSALMVVALVGLVWLVVMAVRRRQGWMLLVAAVALSSFAFYVASLYAGQASLILPRFAPKNSPYTLSNIRYGVQALLPIGLFIAFLGSRWRPLVPVLALAVLLQTGVSVAEGRVMSYVDGTRGLSSQLVSKGPDSPPVEAWMRQHYDGGLLLMDDYRRPIGPVESGLPMQAFIGVGNKPYWQESLDNPGLYATWVVLQQGATDAVWSGFGKNSRAILADHFVEVFTSGSIHVYKRRPAAVNTSFVHKEGQHLYLAGTRFRASGANSYDLLALPPDVAQARLSGFAAAGFTTVRTWCFDRDGRASDTLLSHLDATLAAASTLHLHVICTLGNNYSDWGGPAAFTPAGEHFYTSATAINAYQGQIARVLQHRGPTGVALADDPAVMAWDLLNEPRRDDALPPDAVSSWTSRMAQYVDSIDQSHLVTIGTEGFTAGYPAEPGQAGPAGAGFTDLCKLNGITLCSGHLYPKYLPGKGDASEWVNGVIASWRKGADALNKPVLVGEVGYSISDPGQDQLGRGAYLSAAVRAIDGNDVDGGLIWNVGATADDSFTLQFGDPSSDAVLQAWGQALSR